jgi:hypothetical protein
MIICRGRISLASGSSGASGIPGAGVRKGRESSEIISSFSHANEFVGIWRAAAESVLARAVVHIGRWVYEGGASAKQTGEISSAFRRPSALKRRMPAVCGGFQRPG